MSLLKILIKHNNTAILDRIFIMVIIYIPKYDWYRKMIEKKGETTKKMQNEWVFLSNGKSTECNQSILFKDDIVL